MQTVQSGVAILAGQNAVAVTWHPWQNMAKERADGYRLLFFFQAEDGIRDYKVTGVQTCALPILRRSTIEKNARIWGRWPLKPATNSVSWSSVRTDSVVGISGTTSTSAACMTFSETSEMLGGQSRNTWSYSAASGLSSWPSLRVDFLSEPAVPSSRSMLR